MKYIEGSNIITFLKPHQTLPPPPKIDPINFLIFIWRRFCILLIDPFSTCNRTLYIYNGYYFFILYVKLLMHIFSVWTITQTNNSLKSLSSKSILVIVIGNAWWTLFMKSIPQNRTFALSLSHITRRKHNRNHRSDKIKHLYCRTNCHLAKTNIYRLIQHDHCRI